jgi:L-aminopeptidase/D-esterase-like protein
MRPVPPSPVVPGAILFDMANGGDKSWGEEPPYRALGRRRRPPRPRTSGWARRAQATALWPALLKGGTGSASIVSGDAISVGALVAVNSWGSVVAPGGRTFWAAPFEVAGEFGGLGPAGLAAAARRLGPRQGPRRGP